MGWIDLARAYDARRHRARAAKALYEDALKSKYKPNEKSVEVIGIQSGVFAHITTDSVPGSLTQTIFDTTSRADSAQVLLTNSTGASKVIISAWIRGKPVLRFSGAGDTRVAGAKQSGSRGGSASNAGGFLHDKFVDYERIAQDGDITFETGNNFVVTADQVNRLADYYWKLHRTKKHIYTLSLVGFRSWFEPGEWYTLQIGGEGEAEYIHSTVECFDVRCSLQAGSAPSTSVSFREVEENWKFDSNEVARQIAAGDFSRRPAQNVVTVAAQYYSGYADYYCDGTDDQIEINSAISYLGGMGGEVHLTRGSFDITSSITMSSKVNLAGEGPGSIIKKGSASSFFTVYFNGSAANIIDSINIRDVQFQATSFATNSGGGYIEINYGRNIGIDSVVTQQPFGYVIDLNTIDYASVTNVSINGQSSTLTNSVFGIRIANSATSYSNIIQSCAIKNIVCDQSYYGIYINDAVSSNATQIINNDIYNLNCTGTSMTSSGIRAYTSGGQISSNKVVSCKAPSSTTAGIYILTGSTNVSATNNYCSNNGADTGIANTNSGNFIDGGTDTQWAG